MAEHAEMTDSGFVVRDADGETIASLSWADGVGQGVVLLLRKGSPPLEIGFDIQGLQQLAVLADATLRNARVAAEMAAEEAA